MHYAVRPWPDNEEQIHVLHSLLERKASVNAKNVLGETPLHAAVIRSASPAVVLWLLDRRADPDVMCVRRFREVGTVEPQNTALHYVPLSLTAGNHSEKHRGRATALKVWRRSHTQRRWRDTSKDDTHTHTRPQGPGGASELTRTAKAVKRPVFKVSSPASRFFGPASSIINDQLGRSTGRGGQFGIGLQSLQG